MFCLRNSCSLDAQGQVTNFHSSAWHQNGLCPEAGKIFSLSPSFLSIPQSCPGVPFHRLDGGNRKSLICEPSKETLAEELNWEPQ